MIRLLSIGMVIYMLAALMWWTILLNRSKAEITQSRERIMQLEYNEVFGVKDYDITLMPEYNELKADEKKFRLMIWGEAIVFCIALLLGIYYLYTLYLRKLSIARQQRNFLLSITHELNSPLTSIKLALQTMNQRLLNPTQIKEISENGLEETNRLNSLVEKLLFGAKLESAYEFELFPTQVEMWLENIVHRYRKQYTSHEFDLKVDANKEIMIDRLAMEILMNNLIENAMKYSPNSNKILISAIESNDKLRISVIDEGIGVSKKDRKKIFHQFYRAGSEDTRTTKGTGMGLYIGRMVAKGHKTALKIKDNPKGGSIFYIDI